ncbi:unnamed protein product [Tetraodon nigroviridis]|uniref:(spotted green pufferfish) hypothetical protein n=1 Tax=Tetraodon nigroviridis TaxID=99883 RepID=Q4RRM5_TETNG|nr:unnamed protein product [Tetraodon nigroviridis]
MRDSIVHRLGHSAVFSLPASCGPPAAEPLLSPGDRTQASEVDVTSAFLPEFPHRLFPEQEHYQVLPKSEIIKNKVVDQIKEEVIIQMENVLVSDQGHLRLSDFGLSRRLKRGGRAFTICGTMQYMAPEVLSGGPYSHAADWWSLGILLFALVTGKKTPADIILQLRAHPDWTAKARRGLSSEDFNKFDCDPVSPTLAKMDLSLEAYWK